MGTSSGFGPKSDDLTVEQLRDLLDGLGGVESLEVDLRDEASPRLRLHLDGSAETDEVRSEIHRLLEAAVDAPSSVAADRRGLGKGLADLLAADDAAPAHLDPDADTPQQPVSLALVAVEETVGGISVRAADSAGGVAFSPVEDPKSLNQAVVSAVARLRRQRPLPRLSGVEVRDVEGSPVLTVVLTLQDGVRRVGSSLVEGGMPFTLGQAVWEALAR